MPMIFSNWIQPEITSALPVKWFAKIFTLGRGVYCLLSTRILEYFNEEKNVLLILLLKLYFYKKIISFLI